MYIGGMKVFIFFFTSPVNRGNEAKEVMRRRRHRGNTRKRNPKKTKRNPKKKRKQKKKIAVMK